VLLVILVEVGLQKVTIPVATLAEAQEKAVAAEAAALVLVVAA